MSRDQWLEEFGDVRIPAELQKLMNEVTSNFARRLLHSAARRAVNRSTKRDCVLGKDDLSESIQTIFREGASEWLKIIEPIESSHVRRAS